MKVIIKDPGAPAYYADIPNELKELQRIVEGPIETVTVASDMVIICNEEGRLMNLPPSCSYCGVEFVGTVIFCGVDGDNFCDVPVAGFVMRGIRELNGLPLEQERI